MQELIPKDMTFDQDSQVLRVRLSSKLNSPINLKQDKQPDFIY